MWRQIHGLVIQLVVLIIMISVLGVPQIQAQSPIGGTPGQSISVSTAVVVTTGDLQNRERAAEFLHSIDICYQVFIYSKRQICLPGCVYDPGMKRTNPSMGIPDRLPMCYLFIP